MIGLEEKVARINIELKSLCRCFCSKVNSCLGISSTESPLLYLAKDGSWSNPTGGVPYASYVAKLTQKLENDPIANVLYTNIGNITWTWENTGVYNGYLVDGLPLDSTVIFDSNSSAIPNISNDGIMINVIPVDNSNIKIYTTTFGGIPKDDVLTNYSIEIRVYPKP